MYPAKWFFRKHEEEPTTEVAIRRGVAEDLYIVMPAFDLQDQSASLHIVVNPLVNWIWVGFGVMALGTGHRAAAGAGVQLRSGKAAGRGRVDDHRAPVPAPAVPGRRRAPSTSRRDRTCPSSLAPDSNASCSRT